MMRAKLNKLGKDKKTAKVPNKYYLVSIFLLYILNNFIILNHGQGELIIIN